MRCYFVAAAAAVVATIVVAVQFARILNWWLCFRTFLLVTTKSWIGNLWFELKFILKYSNRMALSIQPTWQLIKNMYSFEIWTFWWWKRALQYQMRILFCVPAEKICFDWPVRRLISHSFGLFDWLKVTNGSSNKLKWTSKSQSNLYDWRVKKYFYWYQHIGRGSGSSLGARNQHIHVYKIHPSPNLITLASYGYIKSFGC